MLLVMAYYCIPKQGCEQMTNLIYDNAGAFRGDELRRVNYFTFYIYHIMANARVLMEVRIVGRLAGGRAIEITRPGKKPWAAALPVVLDQGQATAALVDYVTAQYLVDLPKESIRLGWETVYALVRTALMEANEAASDLLTGPVRPIE